MSSSHAGPYPLCKICGCGTNYAGALDANKCCQDRLGTKMLPVSDIKVPYFACPNCGLVFTTFTDHWTADDFRERIYNADYNRINPPIPGRDHVPLKETPSYRTGTHIASLFDGSQGDIRVLDFGAGGNPGPTGQGLMDVGFQVHSYEPYRSGSTQLQGRYQVIIAIEVLEHCHDFSSVAAFFKNYIASDGIIWVQTALHPYPTPKDILDSWYIAPRDGHISIHTTGSLTWFFNAIGMNFVQTTRGMFAFRHLPKFANKLLISG